MSRRHAHLNVLLLKCSGEDAGAEALNPLVKEDVHDVE